MSAKPRTAPVQTPPDTPMKPTATPPNRPTAATPAAPASEGCRSAERQPLPKV